MNDYSTEQVREYIAKHFGPTRAHYYRWQGTVDEADCTFATFWPTAENVLALPNGGRRYYLVQDFEPDFYPHEPHHYERAEATYRAGFHCITLGPWLAKLLHEKYGARADHFDFGVDTSVYQLRPGLREGRGRVCFYARPATPRRAYPLGLAALKLLNAQMPEVEIIFFGSEELTPSPDFPFVNCGLVRPDELAALFSSADVGVVFSLSNPSFVPLEMMACRCAVVEIESERWDGILAHGRNAWLVQPEAESVADGIIRLLKDKLLRDRIVENAWQQTRAMSWEKSARQIETILLETAR
jgi:glycosyltransferase involved in cell wall biosynthesis